MIFAQSINFVSLREKTFLCLSSFAQVIPFLWWIVTWRKKVKTLDVILQIGAHRTASTSFQTYLRQNSDALGDMNVGYWGPFRLRGGLLYGITPNVKMGEGAAQFARAQGRLAIHLERSRNKGLQHLLISEENMLGSMRHNFASRSLYPAAGERIARYIAAFRGSVKAIHLSLRCPSSYWTSAFSYCIPRGVLVPRQARIDALAQATRTWRDVITDIAAAAPDTAIFVSTYEQHASAPHRLLSYLLAQRHPEPRAQIWRNKRPLAQELLRLPLGQRELCRLESQIVAHHWEPFSRLQKAQMQENYADDLFWLRAGADGLAHLLEDPKSEKTGYPAKLDFVNKGHRYDARQRLARPR